MSQQTHLLIVDDHQVVLDGLRLLLTGVPGVNITGMAREGKEMWLQIEKTDPPSSCWM